MHGILAVLFFSKAAKTILLLDSILLVWFTFFLSLIVLPHSKPNLDIVI